MRLGVPDIPFRTKPPVVAMVILERPFLKVEVEGATSSFFCTFGSLDAAIKAKSRKSPSLRVPPGVTVKLNCLLALFGQSLVPPVATKVQRSPLGEEEAVTCHRVS